MMLRSLIVLGSGLLDSLAWTWLASLILPLTYAAGIGIAAGCATMLLIAAMTCVPCEDDVVRSTHHKTVIPMKRERGALLHELG